MGVQDIPPNCRVLRDVYAIAQKLVAPKKVVSAISDSWLFHGNRR